jgi:hypothetical protein
MLVGLSVKRPICKFRPFVCSDDIRVASELHDSRDCPIKAIGRRAMADPEGHWLLSDFVANGRDLQSRSVRDHVHEAVGRRRLSCLTARLGSRHSRYVRL